MPAMGMFLLGLLLLLLGAEPCARWLPAVVAQDDHGFVLTGRDVFGRGDPEAIRITGERQRPGAEEHPEHQVQVDCAQPAVPDRAEALEDGAVEDVGTDRERAARRGLGATAPRRRRRP